MSNENFSNCGWPFYKITASQAKEVNELLLIAECVSLVYLNFYQDFIKEKNSDIICPKMDNNSQCVIKLANIIKNSKIDKIIIIRMEQKCCCYLSNLVKDALNTANKSVPIIEKIVNQKGIIS